MPNHAAHNITVVRRSRGMNSVPTPTCSPGGSGTISSAGIGRPLVAATCAITARASAVRPATTSHRGDSGTRARIHSTSSAARADVAISGRQPTVGTSSHAKPAATIVPTAQKLSRSTSRRPRALAGQVLRVQREVQGQRATEAEAGEEPEQHEPARARGERRRQPEHREHRDGEDEPAPPSDPVGHGPPEPRAEQHADESGRREQTALMASRPNSARIDGSANPTRSTSAASAAHVTPQTASNRRWNLP